MSAEQLLELKTEIKQCIAKAYAIEGSRGLSLTITKMEEACMWADYALRAQGVDLSEVEEAPEVPDYTEEDELEEEVDPADLVSNM